MTSGGGSGEGVLVPLTGRLSFPRGERWGYGGKGGGRRGSGRAIDAKLMIISVGNDNTWLGEGVLEVVKVHQKVGHKVHRVLEGDSVSTIVA